MMYQNGGYEQSGLFFLRRYCCAEITAYIFRHLHTNLHVVVSDPSLTRTEISEWRWKKSHVFVLSVSLS